MWYTSYYNMVIYSMLFYMMMTGTTRKWRVRYIHIWFQFYQTLSKYCKTETEIFKYRIIYILYTAYMLSPTVSLTSRKWGDLENCAIWLAYRQGKLVWMTLDSHSDNNNYKRNRSRAISLTYNLSMHRYMVTYSVVLYGE